jgi:septum formation protein
MSSVFLTKETPPVVLASASETRANMLASAGIDVMTQPAAVDESEIKTSFKAAGGSPGEAAVALAELKAARVAETLPHETIVLGADQILTCDQDWFDKPTDGAVARKQLERLSGRRHELHTAVVGFRRQARVWHHLDLTRLWMRSLSSTFLDVYLMAVGGDALQSVGGYHMERLGSQLFSRIEGDHFSILGLPLLSVLAFLRDQGVVQT